MAPRHLLRWGVGLAAARQPDGRLCARLLGPWSSAMPCPAWASASPGPGFTAGASLRWRRTNRPGPQARSRRSTGSMSCSRRCSCASTSMSHAAPFLLNMAILLRAAGLRLPQPHPAQRRPGAGHRGRSHRVAASRRARKAGSSLRRRDRRGRRGPGLGLQAADHVQRQIAVGGQAAGLLPGRRAARVLTPTTPSGAPGSKPSLARATWAAIRSASDRGIFVRPGVRSAAGAPPMRSASSPTARA